MCVLRGDKLITDLMLYVL